MYSRIIHERTRTGAELIHRAAAASQMLRALRRGRAVAQLIDCYPEDKQAAFVPLFGVGCSTATRTAILAARTGAPVVPAYTYRIAADRHKAVVLPPVEMSQTGDPKQDVELATARYNSVIENIIRTHPAQWIWPYRRFRHSPDLPDLGYE